MAEVSENEPEVNEGARKDAASKSVAVNQPAAGKLERPTLSHRLEYGLLRGTVGALGMLPWETAARAGASLGLLGYSPFRIRRSVVTSQVAFAFPDLSHSEVERISREAYRSLGRTTVETALLPGLTRQQILDLVPETHNLESVESAMALGRGVVLVTGHLGNWELGGAYVSALGWPLEAIVRRQGNPLFDRYLNRTRESLGNRIIYDADAVRRVPRALRENKVVAFLSDQGVRGLASSFVPFFGKLAKTPRGAAVFALRFGSPIVFVTALRRPDGRFRLVCEPVPVVETDDREADVERIVTAYTAVLERWVREEPEQYFWHHRRWKRQPPEALSPSDNSQVK
ncbi:MAG TPA: lysophospholipid acyltransferase family protein [Gemmatimonadales bacterium]|nr:lysophospholipid acyltransferase family protein [Gemmatimonadales bacterium]